MSLPDEQRARLAQAKVTALARSHLDLEGVAGPFRDGAALLTATDAAPEGPAAVVLIDAPGPRVLGGALTWAIRNGAARLDVLIDAATAPPGVPGHLARLASRATLPTTVHLVSGASAVAAAADPMPTVAPGPGGVETLVALLENPAIEGGPLEVVLEHGVIRGEVLGLEVARVVEEDPLTGLPTDPMLSVGVGRFDREVGAMMFAEMPTAEALARAVAIVRSERFAGAGTRPLSLLGRERWLRRTVIEHPELVGALALHPVETTWERPNLKDPHPALAVGTGIDGEPLVVATTAGVDLDAPVLAADVRAREASDARLVVATSEPAAVPLYRALAERLEGLVEVVTIAGPWAP